MKKIYSIFMAGILAIMTVLFLLQLLTSFEIKSQLVKEVIYLGLFVITPLILIRKIIISEKWRSKRVASFATIFILICVAVVGILTIIFATPGWKTQTILYQNGHFAFKKVEFQMQDIGAPGYRNRTVEVTYLTDAFMIISPVSKNIDESVEWIRVDREVNELGVEY